MPVLRIQKIFISFAKRRSVLSEKISDNETENIVETSRNLMQYKSKILLLKVDQWLTPNDPSELDETVIELTITNYNVILNTTSNSWIHLIIFSN